MQPGFAQDSLLAIFHVDPAKLPGYVGTPSEGGGFSIYKVTQVIAAPSELRKVAEEIVPAFHREMAAFGFQRALEQVWKLVTGVNRHIENTAPWGSARTASAGQKKIRFVVAGVVGGDAGTCDQRKRRNRRREWLTGAGSRCCSSRSLPARR